MTGNLISLTGKNVFSFGAPLKRLLAVSSKGRLSWLGRRTCPAAVLEVSGIVFWLARLLGGPVATDEISNSTGG
jgi:hypothetical protein